MKSKGAAGRPTRRQAPISSQVGHLLVFKQVYKPSNGLQTLFALSFPSKVFAVVDITGLYILSWRGERSPTHAHS